ncbi:MAG: MFS transporter [Clostridia bacterium]|nr:MFS transporter [Clostridia bacterium]
MSTAKPKPRPFYGWVIVLGCALMMGTTVGLFFNCNGVFVKPVCDDLGFSRGAFTMYTTIVSFLSMFMQVIYGDLYRRHRVLPISRAAAVILCLSIVGYSFSTKIWHFYLFATINGLVQVPVAVLAIATLVNRWFIDKRGLATGIAYSGSGLTAALMTPVLTRVVADYGWRTGYRVLAAVGAVPILLAVFVLLKEDPAEMGQTPLGASPAAADASATAAPVLLPETVGLTRAEALRTPCFALMVLSFIIILFCGMGVNPHIISYLTDIGYSDGVASSVSSLIMAVMIVGKISMGAVFDKVGAFWASVMTGLCVVASMVTLALCGTSPIMPYVFACCFGFGYSAGSVPLSFLVGENFGSREFSGIYSFLSMMSGVVASFGTSIIGMLYDRLGSYSSIWLIWSAMAVLCTGTLTLSAVLARKGNYNPAAIGRRK